MNYQKLVRTFALTTALALTAFSSAQSQSPHYVFAHYLVCNCDYGGSVEAYEHDITDAQAAGIDGFALNCGDWNGGNYIQCTANMFQAAAELNTGFKLFFSADMSGTLSLTEIVSMVSAYGKNPYYFKYQGKPVLSTFGGETPWGSGQTQARWQQIKAELAASGNTVFFAPYFYSQVPTGTGSDTECPTTAQAQSNFSQTWQSVIDGYFYPATARVPSLDSAASQALTTILHNGGKVSMAGLSPQYWGSKQVDNGRRYYEYDGGEGIVSQWESIINSNPDWVELFTWNDFDEATYWSPIDDPVKYWPNYQHNTLGFYHTHAGALKLASYFIDWYKTGVQPPPPGNADNVYFFYRTEPKAMEAPFDPLGPVSWITGDIADDIYITTILPTAAQLVVTSGGVVTKVSVAAGLINTRVPFAVGAQTIALVRNGATIVSIQGVPIVASSTAYNFNYETGYGQD